MEGMEMDAMEKYRDILIVIQDILSNPYAVGG